MNKIIYSLQVMLQLVEKGNIPINQMPNPKYPKYQCWIFKVTPKFQQDLDSILGVDRDGEC